MRLIIMSDMHRGDGSGADDFAKNSLIYRCALAHYLEEGFTYIELGDAEELWENENFDQIYITHTPVYELLAKFHDPDPVKTRYLKVWGNHDLYWKGHVAVYRTLFPGIEIHEGVILDTGGDECTGGGDGRKAVVGGTILLIHGHQADPKCSGEGAAVSKFFVHHFWPDLQRCGAKDPTRAALNPGLCNEVDRQLHEWANHNDQGIAAIIAGHTHRAVFENLSLTERRYLESKIKTEGIEIKHQPDGSYYNTGSCVHPLSITGIEITFEGSHGPRLCLVEWGQATEGHAVTIQREELS
jgi:predicted phosphodiesterase